MKCYNCLFWSNGCLSPHAIIPGNSDIAKELNRKINISIRDTKGEYCPYFENGKLLQSYYDNSIREKKTITNEEARKILEGLKDKQDNTYICPRCGRSDMNPVAIKNALSRRIDIYICSECGMAEALEDVGMLRMKGLNDWLYIREQEHTKNDVKKGEV